MPIIVLSNQSHIFPCLLYDKILTQNFILCYVFTLVNFFPQVILVTILRINAGLCHPGMLLVHVLRSRA